MQIMAFISGMGILLLAMRMLEQSLALLGEGHLRQALQRGTSTPFQGVLLGIFMTAILQSSSIVGLMTMAFIGAGVLPLRNGIGVIMGSNLGTTFTGWLVAWIGFKLDLAEFYTICIGAGALVTVMSKESGRLQSTGRFVTAFGLLLFGLVLMKESISFVVELIDVASLRALSLPVYFCFGVMLTALIQSSSATMMISLSALSAGILDLQSAAVLIVGADLGTTSTVVLGSLGGSTTKRQIALVHVVFNVATALIALLSMSLILKLIADVYSIEDQLFSLVAFHSTFNLMGLFMIVPFASRIEALVEKLVPGPKKRKLLIAEVTTEVPAAAFSALEQDVRMLLAASILLNAWRLGLLQDRKAARETLLAESVEIAYNELKDAENELTDYLLELGRKEMEQVHVSRLQQLRVCVRDSLYSTKAIKDLEKYMKLFMEEEGSPRARFLSGLLTVSDEVYGTLLDILEGQDKVSPEQLRQLLDRVRIAHDSANSDIYEAIDQRFFAREQASSALNINREFLLAGHSLVNALEHCMLPGEQARTVSELLNLRN